MTEGMLSSEGIANSSTILDGVPANHSHFKEDWEDVYARKFREVLTELDDATLHLVATSAGVDIHETNRPISDIISVEEKSVFLFTIFQFLQNKRISVREFGSELGDNPTKGSEYRYVLEKLLSGEHRFLYKLLLYHRWLKGTNKRRYEIENRLPENYFELFDENFKGIQLTLARRTRSRLFRCPPDNRITLENGTLFTIDRQTSDHERRDITGPQRRRNVGSVFLKIDEVNESVIVQSNSQRIRETLVDKLEEVLSISLRDLTEDVHRSDISPEKFENKLSSTDDSPDTIEILNVEFRRTNISPAVPLTISKKTEDRDIRPVVKAFSEDILDKNLENIRRFWCKVHDIDTRVVVEISYEQDYLRLNSDIKTQSERNRNQVRESFRNQFGIPLDNDIPISWLTNDITRIVALYLNNPPTFQKGSSPHEGLLEELESIGLIILNVVVQRQCLGCDGLFNQDRPDCPNCGGTLEVFKEDIEVEVDQDGVRQYFEKKVKTEGIEYLGTKTERIYQTKYNFVRIQKGPHPVNVLLNTDLDNLTSNAILHLRKSLYPVLVVSPGLVKNQSLIDQELADSVDIGKMIYLDMENDLPDDFLTEKIEKISRAVEQKVAQNARDSFERLPAMLDSPKSFSGEQFERELFHLFNQVVSNTEQWGSKRSGNVPDGFGEIVFKKGGKQYYRSFAYDAKFTKHDELDLDTGDSRTLRDYVHRIKDSEEVKSSNTMFANFLVITNANPGNFGTTDAARLNRMTSWSGTPVLMHVEFLLGLHVAYNKNVRVIRDHISTFYELLYRTFNEGNLYQTDNEEEYFVHLEGGDVEELMANFESEVDDGSIDISELRKFLEQDLFP